MAHKHIGPEDWPVIARMLKAGFTGSEIARTIGKDPGAVNRHVKQNGGRDGYDVREARRRKHHQRIAAMDGIRVLKGSLLRTVIKLLREHYSPEQIAGTLAQKGMTIVASTIYRYLKERAPHLKKYLRSQKGKYRRKRGTRLREK
jgi:IS30 family transposase